MIDVGSVIEGRYELRGRLGRGAMGEVFFARDTASNQEVAVKILHDDSHSEMLAREADALAQLDHPGSVRVLATGTAEGQAYVVMQLVKGQTLEALLERSGRLSAWRAVAITAEVLDTLAAAHERQIVHRDVKPSNIMLVKERAMVLDFGMAQIGTPDREAVGTLAYMAPEQIRGEAVDARADVWAVGVLLFRLVGGRLPFDGDNARAYAANAMSTTPLSLRTIDATVDPRLEQVVRRALEKNPDDRFATALEMREALRALLQEGIRFDTKSQTHVHQTVAGARRAGKGPLIAVLVTAFIALAATAWFLIPRDEAREALEKFHRAQIGPETQDAFFAGFERFKDDPETLQMAVESLAFERRDAPRAEAPFDSSYHFEVSEWRGASVGPRKGTHAPFVLKIETLGTNVATGTLEWPNFGVRTRFYALHEGNHIVLWEPEMIAGVGEYVDSYALKLRMSFVVMKTDDGKYKMETPMLPHGEALVATRVN